MRKMIKFVYCSFVLIILLQMSVFAEPQLQYIEYWKDGSAYNSRREIITDCTAYDYLSAKPDKFVRLDANGKEAARADVPAEITQTDGQVMGTVELSATVPESINNAVEVVLWDSDNNSYTLTAYKDNNYAAYANLSPGTYSVFSANIKDDFKGEYPVKCDKDEIVIEPSAASKIKVTVSKKQDLTNPFTYMGTDGENGDLTAVNTPAPTDEPIAILSPDETKSLIKSTIIMLSVAAILFLSYRLVTWYRNRKDTRIGGN